MKVYFRKMKGGWKYITEYGDIENTETKPKEIKTIYGEEVEPFIEGIDEEASKVYNYFDYKADYVSLKTENGRLYADDKGTDYPKIEKLNGEYIEPICRTNEAGRDYMEFSIPRYIKRVVIHEIVRGNVKAIMYDIEHV